MTRSTPRSSLLARVALLASALLLVLTAEAAPASAPAAGLRTPPPLHCRLYCGPDGYCDYLCYPW